MLSQGDAVSSAAARSGKKQKKRKVAEDTAGGDVQGTSKARAPRNRADGWGRHRDLRHLSVDFLCSFMDSGKEGRATFVCFVVSVVAQGIPRANAVSELVLLARRLGFLSHSVRIVWSTTPPYSCMNVSQCMCLYCVFYREAL